MGSPTRPTGKGSSFTRTPEQVQWDFVKLWLAKAAEDLQAADVIRAGPMPSFGAASFHAQQAAEKALKALLIRHQVDFRKTHDIGQLLRLAEPVAVGVAERLADARVLTPYAVSARYPTQEPPVAHDEATRHVALARKVLGTVSGLLKTYLDAGRPGR